MQRRSISIDYKNYPYVPPSYSSLPRNSQHQNYDPIQHTEQVLYANTIRNPTYTPPDVRHKSQPLPTIPDMSDSLSVFDERKPPVRLRSTTTSVSAGYVPPNPIHRSSVSDTRLATANVMRERLLTDIQDNITEIDRELSTLEIRPMFANYVPPRFSSSLGGRQTSMHPHTPNSQHKSIPEQDYSSNDEDQGGRRKKSKKVYEVVPRTASTSRKASKRPASKIIDQTILESFVGQYHYGAEMGENEIDGNDPESTELTSTTEEIPESKYETLSTNEFLREQSPTTLDRALIAVPIQGDKKDVGDNETTAEFHSKKPTEIKIERSSTVTPLLDIISADKIHIQDFVLLIKTAPEPKVQVLSQTTADPPDSSDDEVINTMFSKPLKHARLSTRTAETHSSTQPANKNSAKNTSGGGGGAYFFSDFGNEGDGEGEEDLISLDLSNFAVPLSSDMAGDDNTSNALMRRSQISLLNPHQKQQSTKENDKEEESKKNDATKKDTARSTSSSKQTLPTSANDNMKTQSTKNNNNSNEPHHQPSRKISNVNTAEPPKETKSTKSSFHFNSSLLALENKDSIKAPAKLTNIPEKRQVSGNKQSRFTRQRSASVRNGSKIQPPTVVARRPSVTSPDTSRRPGKPTNQSKLPAEVRRTSGIPVPLHSADYANERLSTSRSTTPERRNSTPSFDENVLLSLLDIINSDDPFIMIPTDHQQTESDQQFNDEPSVKSPCDERTDPVTTINNSEHEDLLAPSSSLAHHTSVKRKDRSQRLTTIHHTNNRLKKSTSSRSSEQKSINIARSKYIKNPSSSSSSQLMKKASLSTTSRQSRSKRKPTNDQSSPPHIADCSSINDPEKPQQQLHVFFCNTITRFPIHHFTNWNEHLHTFVTKKYSPDEKYSFMKSPIDHFQYHHLKEMFTLPKKNIDTKESSDDQIDSKENECISEPTQEVTPILISQLFKQLWPLTEPLYGNAQPKLESYLSEKLYPRCDIEILTTKSECYNETDSAELREDISHRSTCMQTDSMPTISDDHHLHSREQESETELKNAHPTARRKTEPDIDSTYNHWNFPSDLQYSSAYELYPPTTNNDFSADYYDWTNTSITNYPSVFVTQTFECSDDNLNDQSPDESPPNRPKWNSVSKTRSVNFIYNPKVSNSTSIRRGWDSELRRKRVQKLPPLEQTRNRDEIPQLAIEAPPSNGRLALDYSYDNSPYERSNGTTPSRRSSRALVPIRRYSDNQLVSDTPRSQRPVHQEWYDEMNRSHITHRMDIEQTTNNSFRDSLQRRSTSRDLVPLNSFTQHSLTNGSILDSSVRTNRATELRLSRDMEEHHHHCHDVSQSMPFEIRGFHLQGMQLTNPDEAKIRPLSNVNYRTSERVKTRRIYPLGNPYQSDLSMRHNSLLPIAEFRQSSFSTSIVEIPQSIHEE